MIGRFDDWENGPGFWEPDGLEDIRHDAFEAGAKSRDDEVRQITLDLWAAETDRDAAKAEVERLTRLLCVLGAVEAA